jgi:hypothetical protein
MARDVRIALSGELLEREVKGFIAEAYRQQPPQVSQDGVPIKKPQRHGGWVRGFSGS